jgi:hypothetical protein
MEVPKKLKIAGHLWLMPAILATGEAAIGRTVVLAKPGQQLRETQSLPIAGRGGTCLSSLLWQEA